MAHLLKPADLTLDIVKKAMLAKGHLVFEGGASKGYNLNIVGVRSKERTAGVFDDVLTVFYRLLPWEWQFHAFPGTTDSGLHYLKHPMNPKGTAILVPGQYRGVYKIGKHRNAYTALVQMGGKVDVWRDRDRDNQLEQGPVDRGMHGINIHRALRDRELASVGRHSAGCQVFANPVDFNYFMNICALGRDRWSNSFTYTLLDEVDLTL